MRSSAVLGFVGLPTLGFHLHTAFKQGHYSEVAALLLLFYVIIATIRIWMRKSLLPIYLIVKDIGMLDNVFTLVILYTSMNLPIAVWMMQSFLSEIPVAVIEAAQIDGARLRAGEEVELRVTRTTVEVLYRNRRIASHLRSARRGGYTTVPEHMPAAHRAHAQWTPQRLIHWAGTIGVATRSVVTYILETKPHPEQGYRACLGMLALARTYSNSRLEAACARAVHLGAKSRKSVASILANGLDRQSLPHALYDETSLPAHANVRGAKYYH